VATASTTKTAPTTEVPDFAVKIREQVLAAVQQGQQLSIDAVQAWVKAVSVLPTPDLQKVPGLPAVPSAQAVSTFTFDVASDLLNARRDYVSKLVSVLVPDQSV